MINSHNTAQNGFHQTIRKVFTETPTHLTGKDSGTSQGGDQNNNRNINEWRNLSKPLDRSIDNLWSMLIHPINVRNSLAKSERYYLITSGIDKLWYFLRAETGDPYAWVWDDPSYQHVNDEESEIMQVDQYIDNLWSNFIGDNNSQPESQSTDDQNNINQEQEVESGDEHVENVDVNIENVDEYIEKLWSDYIAA